MNMNIVCTCIYIYMYIVAVMQSKVVITWSLVHKCIHIHILMRVEKEGRKKQARSNKQQGKATQYTQGSHFSLKK